MKSVIAAAVFAAALSFGAAAQATEFVTNGDFTTLSAGVGEIDVTTVATGWTSNGGYSFVMNKGDVGSVGSYGALSLWDAANSGNNTWDGKAAGAGNFLAMDGDFMTTTVTQLITGLTIGQGYDLTFNYAFGQQTGFDGPTVQHMTVALGDNFSTVTSDFNVGNHGFTGWQSASFHITADAASETLSFLAYGDKPVPPFALISNVSLTGGGVPEPAAWAMMLVGFGGLGALARLRARKAAQA